MLFERTAETDYATKKKRMLPADFKPNNYTVICGRGKECFNAVGNRRFRCIVDMHIEKYSLAMTKTEKSQIVTTVIDTIHQAGGMFVRKEKGIWYETSSCVTREKVGAHFRDCLHMQYRSSAKCKTARRRALRIQKARKLEAKVKFPKEDECTVATACTECSFNSVSVSEHFPPENKYLSHWAG